LIDATVRAPGAVSQLPCCFTAVLGRDLLDRISRGALAFMRASLKGNPQANHFCLRLTERRGSSRTARWQPGP
jgi:hypothetical protein